MSKLGMRRVTSSRTCGRHGDRVDLTDAGLREQEARDRAAHVVIEAGLGREAWPIVMLALDAARAEQGEADAKIARDFIDKGAYANTCLDIARAIRAQGEG